MTLEEIIAELRARPSQTVPFAGMALGELQRGASYTAAKTKTLGVPVFWSGGKLRTSSIAIAKVLADRRQSRACGTNQQTDARALPSAVLEAAPARLREPPAVRLRKLPTPKAAATRKATASEAPRPDRRRSRQAEPVA